MNREAAGASSAREDKYRHLRIGPKPGFVLTNRGWESRARFRARKLISGSPLLCKSLQAFAKLATRSSAVIDYLTSLAAEEKSNRAHRDLLDRDAAGANEPGSGYGSADAIAEFTTTLNYARIFDADPALDATGTLSTARCVEETFASVASADPSISRCLNFGVSYGHVDAILASRFPHIEFVGLDRSPLTKVFNELSLPPSSNLKFVADDVFRTLAERRWTHGVFLHCRTLVQLPISFIERLYDCVFASGFEYILGFEPVDLSRSTHSNFEFSDEHKPSQLFRDNLFLHNYPGLAVGARFSIQRIDLLKTSHPHEDYRVLYFVAQRQPA